MNRTSPRSPPCPRAIDTTQIYLHADMTLKEKALHTTPPGTASRDATDRPTPCSPSSTTSDPPMTDPDYAACTTSLSGLTRQQHRPRGITRESA